MTGIRCNSFLKAAVTSTVLLATSLAYAGPGSGNGEHFTYSNYSDPSGLFGPPTVGACGIFYFFGLGFNVDTAAPPGQKTGTVSFDVQAESGWLFGLLDVWAEGMFTVDGSLEDGNYAQVDAEFAVTELDGLGREWRQELAMTPDLPFTEDDEVATGGLWSGEREYDLTEPSPPVSTQLHIELAMDVLAEASAGGSASVAFMPGSGLLITIGTVPVPEPNSLSLLALGGWAVLRRRR